MDMGDGGCGDLGEGGKDGRCVDELLDGGGC